MKKGQWYSTGNILPRFYQIDSFWVNSLNSVSVWFTGREERFLCSKGNTSQVHCVLNSTTRDPIIHSVAGEVKHHRPHTWSCSHLPIKVHIWHVNTLCKSKVIEILANHLPLPLTMPCGFGLGVCCHNSA